MRWILLGATLGALALAIFGPTPGWVGLGMIALIPAALATVLAFAQTRIELNARPEELNDFEVRQLRGKPPAAAPGPDDRGDR